jgi:hypothetical protein
VAPDPSRLICAPNSILRSSPRHNSPGVRRAHELFATVGEVGVPLDGAAGTMFEALSHFDCTINPHEIQQKAGGGASCSFDPGAN